MSRLANLLRDAIGVGLARYKTFGNSLVGMVAPDNSPILIPRANPRRRAVFLGDSLTWGGAGGRASGIFDGRIWYQLTTITFTNLGGGTWLTYGMVEGTAGSAGGTLQTDGNGGLQWKYSTDSYGPIVNVSQGGFFYLSSGTLANSGIFVAVRGATAAPASPGSGAVTTSGLPTISDYNLLGYVPWVAGMLGDTFSDYQAYGISGCTSADVLQFAPQALAVDVEAVFILIGVNDQPTSAALANALVANVKAIIDLARAKARRVYVLDIFPWPAGTQAQQQYLARASNAIRAYCQTKSNTRFVSAYDEMFAPNSSSISSYANARTGVYNPADSLHLMPFGGYLVGARVVAAVQQDYQLESPRRCALDTWDSTMQVGALNLNPGLRGTAGSVQGSAGITGTAPDSYNLTRSGSTQTCTTSFDAAADNGPDWWSMSVAGATAGDYHMLKQTVTLPSGVTAGTDYVQLVIECMIGAMTTPGIAICQAQINSNSNLQSSYPVQITTGRNLDVFTTQTPVLHLRGEPMKLSAAATAFDVLLRVGAAASGGAGKVSFRKLRLEKCAGPIYP